MALPIIAPLVGQAISLLMPDIIKLVQGLIDGGKSAEEAAAAVRLLFDTADLVADMEENRKFPVP